MKNHVKIRFAYVGQNPAEFEVESLWAIKCEDGLFRIDNIPFFVHGISLGDLVSATKDTDEVLWFDRVVSRSGHSTIRILFLNEAEVGPTRTSLRELGCNSEGSHIQRLISVDVPPDVSFETIKKFLDDGEHEGCFEYEEGNLGFSGD